MLSSLTRLSAAIEYSTDGEEKALKEEYSQWVGNLQHVSLPLLYSIHLPASTDTCFQLPSHSYRMECRIQ